MNRHTLAFLSVFFILALPACSDDSEPSPGQAAEASDELTTFEEEHGIGPFTEEVTLDGEVDEELARMGQEVFEFNCEACHALDERFVGPPLGRILDYRSPTFVMNMIMNPSEMADRHPVVPELLREYPVVMPYQNISEEQARAIVEYLRTTDP